MGCPQRIAENEFFDPNGIPRVSPTTQAPLHTSTMPTSICSFIAARAAARAAAAYAPCRNKATAIVFELAYFCLVDGCGYPDEGADYTGNDMWNFLQDQMENDPDRYDEEWFAIAATPAIGAAVDWDWVAMRINGMIAMSEDEWEAADIMSYAMA